ncbi:MAG: MoaD/ThiS family protein [Thermoplasmatota archaeon]
MKVKVEGKGKITLPDDSDVNTLIKELGHHIDSVIVLNDGEPVPDDSKIKENEDYKVISVVSGG